MRAATRGGIFPKRVRLGFSGAGALAKSLVHHNLIEVAGCANGIVPEVPFEPSPAMVGSVEELAKLELDGLVIGPASANPLEEIAVGLSEGLAVFCHCSLASSVNDVHRIVSLARRQDRLLTCDFPYRRLTGATAIRRILAESELGKIFALDFVFHCAGRPRQPWLVSGEDRGCLAECGIHMLDLALWCVGYPEVKETWGTMVSEWEEDLKSGVEHFAAVKLVLQNNASVQVSCSRKLPPGCPAIIQGSIAGTRGTAEFRNVSGSFTQFSACRIQKPDSQPLPAPLRSRSAQSVIEWAKRLVRDNRFDDSAERLLILAETMGRLDR